MSSKSIFKHITNVTSAIVLGDLKEKIVTKEDIKKDLKPIKKNIGILSEAVQKLNHAVVEIQKHLETTTETKFTYKVDPFSISMSPLRLKPEFRPFITKTGLAKQIKDKESELVSWLKSEKPKTGGDAQIFINRLIMTRGIEKFLDLTAYRQHVYEKGRMPTDGDAILALYLYEILIPQVIK